MKQRFRTATSALLKAIEAKAAVPDRQKATTIEQFALVKANVDKLDREVAKATSATQREAKLKKRYIAIARLQELADLIADGRIYTVTRSTGRGPIRKRDKGHALPIDTVVVSEPKRELIQPSRLLSPIKVGNRMKGPQHHRKRWSFDETLGPRHVSGDRIK